MMRLLCTRLTTNRNKPVKKLSFKSLILTFLVGAFFGSFVGIPLHAGAAFVGARMASASFGVMPTGAAYTAVDVSTILADYGDDHKQDLIASLVNGLDIAQDIMVIPNVKGKAKLTKLTVGDGFRPYSSTTEFKASQLGFTKRELVTKTGKRELLIDWRDFKTTYLALRTSPGAGANKDFNAMEFAPFVWAEVIKNLQREINDETAYFGFDSSATPTYSEAATYAANLYVKYTVNGVVEYFQNISGGTTTAGQDPIDTPAKWRNVTARAVVPGIKSYLDALIASTDISAVSTGAISDGTTALAAFRELFRSHAPAYQKNGLIIHASYTDCDFLMDGIEDKLTKYTTPEVSNWLKLGLIPLPGTDGRGFVKRATWLTGSRRLIANPMIPGTGIGKGIVMGTDLLSDGNDIKTKANLWSLEAGIALDLGFQIPDPDAIRVGDQA